MLPQPVCKYLEDHRNQHLGALAEFLTIPSIANVHDQPDSCQRAAAWLADYCRRLGMDVQVLPCSDRGEHDRPNVVARLRAGDDRPTLLVYGHYDVQPPDPLDLWKSSPFEPIVRDGALYARGASDDKGQLFAHLMAIEAWQKAGGGVPVNITLFAEGEEEVGSPYLEKFLATNKDLLAADAAVISDSDWFAEGLPSILYSLRGIAYFEVSVTGPSIDIHSGAHGGAVANPANILARMIGQMHDDRGRVTIPGFYDEVLPLSDAERNSWAGLPVDDKEYAASLGVEALTGGEAGYSALERRWARPTLDCNGIVGGYTGVGSKTIIPARASAKFSIRLVPHQDPAKIVAGVRQYVADHTPAGVKSELVCHTATRPVLLPTDSQVMRAARSAMAECFGREPVLTRCGASVPITEMFQRLLGLDAVLMGFGLPTDNLHGPNEHLRLDNFYRGAACSAAFLGNLSGNLRR